MVAKRQDIERFLRFFAATIGSDAIDDWTPAVSKAFAAMLVSEVSAKTQKPLCATTVNRVMATLRTFARWVHKERAFLAGMPLTGVKPRTVDAPAWYGLTDRQVIRLKVACEQRQSFCVSKIQQPRLETAVFMVLLMTGMREHELVALDVHQYRERAFHEVKRKGAKVTKRINLHREAREALDTYIKEVRGALMPPSSGPIFVGRSGNRLTVHGVGYICGRLAKQASVNLPPEERFRLTPHMLRHTFLRRVADKHGIHVAQELSGNVGMREIFRYTKPSDADMVRTVEELF